LLLSNPIACNQDTTDLSFNCNPLIYLRVGNGGGFEGIRDSDCECEILKSCKVSDILSWILEIASTEAYQLSLRAFMAYKPFKDGKKKNFQTLYSERIKVGLFAEPPLVSHNMSNFESSF
jgi:hypothetical protein